MMNKSQLFGNLNSTRVFWIIGFTIPALYINLGLLPLIGDEAIRAVVALEMKLSGNYITPTLNGELYFNKPPLFNWILIGFFNIFNRTDEWMVRFPTTLFLILYCFTIYWWVKKQLGRQLGILAALMFLTCGRILFWDSFLGLIDIAYSWLIFLNFMLMWHFFQKQEFTRLFLVSYMLTAISFLLKGVPSLAFQGITLVILLSYTKNFRRLFSWQHLTGIFLFLVITGAYYIAYYRKNPDHIGTLLLRLVTESAQKSALGSGIEKTFRHVFAFPFEVLFHFVPWTLMIILAFSRKIFVKALSNGFIRYCTLVFLANIILYWLSPVTYPRYLLMLVPLAFIVFLYLARIHARLGTPHDAILRKVLLMIMFPLVLANALLPVVFAGRIAVDNLYVKSLLLFAAGILVLYFLYFAPNRSNVLLSLGVILLISRISFDLFLVPYRQSKSWLDLCRKDALELARETKGEELYLYADTLTIPNVYYITRERNEILRHGDIPLAGSWFIVKDTLGCLAPFKKELTMRVPYYTKYFYAGKFILDP
jgi:4-amino-4-deoxy-L-arabinose transferase-like glycosyltransferase